MISRSRVPRLPFLLIWSLCFIPFIAVTAETWGANSMRTPGLALINGAATLGFIALLATGLVAVCSRRPMTLVDVVRMACWVAIGICGGVKLSKPSIPYFTFINGYYPSYVPSLDFVATLVILIAGTTIAMSLLLCHRSKTPKPDHCTHCEYDLTGNVTGVCPECGRQILSTNFSPNHTA